MSFRHMPARLSFILFLMCTVSVPINEVDKSWVRKVHTPSALSASRSLSAKGSLQGQCRCLIPSLMLLYHHHSTSHITSCTGLSLCVLCLFMRSTLLCPVRAP
ncbi:hypothetical protein ARMSODRAFT_608513 [Armillaria solidipes]|uniref:Secreted protein n=1 Tax=Armillaria solidipes TaxID=1076256 RepID=A0A2H3BCD1_9AGAR|nr:hypothetical protein ARMSODRAFT_608513 [Armillaria solidipes]